MLRRPDGNYCTVSVRAGSFERENIPESSGDRDAVQCSTYEWDSTVLQKGRKDSTLQRTGERGQVRLDASSGNWNRGDGSGCRSPRDTQAYDADHQTCVPDRSCDRRRVQYSTILYCPCRFIYIQYPRFMGDLERARRISPVLAPIFRTYGIVPVAITCQA